ncbi:hypothetical protein QTP88_005581 [Uroleucon formosanum]
MTVQIPVSMYRLNPIIMLIAKWELFVIAVIAEEEEKREKRLWVHNINLKREEHLEFLTLFPDLLQDEANFFKYCRMSLEKCFELLNMLPQLQKQDTTFRRCIPPDERLAITLKFLSYTVTLLQLFRLVIGLASLVRKIIYDTCGALWEVLQPVFMPQPTVEQLQRVEDNFWRIWNYPNCIALVDADYKLITVDVGAYGRNSDGGIFISSSLGQALSNGTLNIPTPKSLPLSDVIVPHVIVCDEAFPLTKSTMRPFPGNALENNRENKIYNYRHCREKRVVENAFSILAKKFKIYNRKFNLKQENMDTIILETTVLHIFLRNYICYWQPGELEDPNTPEGLNNLTSVGGNNS